MYWREIKTETGLVSSWACIEATLHGTKCKQYKCDFYLWHISSLLFKIHSSVCRIYDALYSHFSRVDCYLHSSLAQNMRIFPFKNMRFSYFGYCMTKELQGVCYFQKQNIGFCSLFANIAVVWRPQLMYIVYTVGSLVTTFKTHTLLVQYLSSNENN